MSHTISRRSLLAAGLTAVGAGVAAGTSPLSAQTSAAAAAPKGAVTLESLGKLLTSLGLKVTLAESRYDFDFAQKIEKEEEWVHAMSAVLSADARSVWLMAWLEELPQSSADVPRTALLRLLADNDRLGNGHFFAYVADNKHFTLQRVIPNENITAAGLKAALLELGTKVAGMHPHWSVANWKQLGTGTSTTAGATPPATPAATVKPAAPATSVKPAAPPAAKTATKSAAETKPGTARK